jgi:hypothetical protein
VTNTIHLGLAVMRETWGDIKRFGLKPFCEAIAGKL